MSSPNNPFDRTNQDHEIALIKKVLEPTNPYSMYNATDRFLNVEYRLFTIKKFNERQAANAIQTFLPGRGPLDTAAIAPGGYASWFEAND